MKSRQSDVKDRWQDGVRSVGAASPFTSCSLIDYNEAEEGRGSFCPRQIQSQSAPRPTRMQVGILQPLASAILYVESVRSKSWPVTRVWQSVDGEKSGQPRFYFKKPINSRVSHIQAGLQMALWKQASVSSVWIYCMKQRKHREREGKTEHSFLQSRDNLSNTVIANPLHWQAWSTSHACKPRRVNRGGVEGPGGWGGVGHHCCCRIGFIKD